MLEKYLDIPPSFGDVPSVRMLSGGLEKQASRKFTKSEEDAVMPSTLEFIRNLQSSDRYVYILVVPIGVGEVWGYNLRHDMVPRAHLVPDITTAEYQKRPYGYRTFTEGNFFYHHKNKPKEGHIIYGDIPFVEFNPRMQLVETVVRADLDQINKYQPSDLEVIQSGVFDVSMGLLASADVCSICRNVRRTVRDKSCPHIQPPIIGTIYPNGVVAGMINLYVRFPDISRVWHGADSIAHGLAKVASDPEKEKIRDAVKRVLHSGSSIITPGRMRAIPSRKYGESDLEKLSRDLPKDQLPEMHRVAESLGKAEKGIPKELLEARKKHPPEQLLSALSEKGVMLRPEEFQSLALPPEAAGQCIVQRTTFRIPLTSLLSGLAEMGDSPDLPMLPSGPAVRQQISDLLPRGRSWLPEALSSRMTDMAFPVGGSSPELPWGQADNPELVKPYLVHLLSSLRSILSSQAGARAGIEKDASWPLIATVLPALYFSSLLYRDALNNSEPNIGESISPFGPIPQIPQIGPLTIGSLPIMAPIGPPLGDGVDGTATTPRTLLEQLILWNPALGTSLLNLARMGASKVLPTLSTMGRAVL